MSEPMKDSTLPKQESIDSKIIEEIDQLKRKDLAEGAVTCQVCDARIREGGRITVSAFRSDSDVIFEIYDTLCRGHGDEYNRSWDRSSRELVVQGRVGIVSDAATQSSWMVLLEPELVALSPLNTVEAYTPSDTDPDSGADGEDPRVDVTHSDVVKESSGCEQPSSWCDGGGSQ
ncbi:hypothetical protein [Halorubrum ezzemoulense]|uniref:hypothetical protein n=1 Tax=Halorubrum ezzemoulense TaxID=337243 RepID=UPI00232C5EC5|nr:hypothetical protein [Halorubrum ezzemoulense]MDB9233793.1 hypothetical protein [Halorubrum ezzemoulense]